MSSTGKLSGWRYLQVDTVHAGSSNYLKGGPGSQAGFCLEGKQKGSHWNKSLLIPTQMVGLRMKSALGSVVVGREADTDYPQLVLLQKLLVLVGAVKADIQFRHSRSLRHCLEDY